NSRRFLVLKVMYSVRNFILGSPFSYKDNSETDIIQNFLHRKRLNLMTVMKVVKGKGKNPFVSESKETEFGICV
ncbi:MAG: hypothetical protein AAB283_00425, partial [Planctomycetota bacterium]